jgi:hypothetical protein
MLFLTCTVAFRLDVCVFRRLLLKRLSVSALLKHWHDSERQSRYTAVSYCLAPYIAYYLTEIVHNL